MAARRRKRRGATTLGGWGHAHQRRRAAIAPIVNAGRATCARCNETIHAGEEWRLDHNDARDGYLGVSRTPPATFATEPRRQTVDRGADLFIEQPYRWSQRWHDDGTIVFGHERVIYLGNGEWQPLDGTPN